MKRITRLAATAMLALSISGLATTGADARRGGSFGSRGSRTYSAPRQTYGSGYVPPVQRSMTPRSDPGYQGGYPGYQRTYPGYAQTYPRSSYPRSHFGFGSGLLGGLVAGGLIGHFLGHGGGYGYGAGYGGGGGFLASIIQLLVIGGLIWFAVSFFRRRQGGGTSFGGTSFGGPASGPSPFGGFQGTGYEPQPQAWGGGASGGRADIQVTPSDQAAFERILLDVQDAYSQEDHQRLRELCTPEIVSYFSEELAQNAASGVRNDVSATRLNSAEVSEAWSENGVDYATVALRYESVDVMRSRSTGAVVGGSTARTQTIEYWTYRRDATGTWKLSAIQES